MNRSTLPSPLHSLQVQGNTCPHRVMPSQGGCCLQACGLKKLRQQIEACPLPLSSNAFGLLVDAGLAALPSVHEHVPLPGWAKPFVTHRAELRDAVVVLSKDGHQFCVKVAYVVANPPVVVFWPLIDVSDADNHAILDLLGHDEDEPMTSRFLWKYEPVPPMQCWELDVQDADMTICPRVQLLGAALLGSDLDLETAASFIEMLDRAPSQVTGKSSDAKKLREPPATRVHDSQRPWLSSILGSTTKTGSSSTSKAASSRDSCEQMPVDEDAGNAEEDVGHAEQIRGWFQELASKQLELKSEPQKDDHDLRVSFVGETRSMQKKAAAVAAVKAHLRVGSHAELWAKESND